MGKAESASAKNGCPASFIGMSISDCGKAGRVSGKESVTPGVLSCFAGEQDPNAITDNRIYRIYRTGRRRISLS